LQQTKTHGSDKMAGTEGFTVRRSSPAVIAAALNNTHSMRGNLSQIEARAFPPTPFSSLNQALMPIQKNRWQMADGRWQMADGRWQMIIKPEPNN